MRARFAIAMLGLCCALAPANARSQGAGGEAELQPVVIEAPPAPGEADRAPAAATTVIDVASQAAEGRSTPELVARAPGAIVHSYGGPGQMATLSLRGASSAQCVVLLDGVPITNALTGTVDLASLPPSFLDRIEVVRGVVGPLYGPGALGGVVNLVSRPARGGPPAIDAEMRGGSFGTGELRLAASSGIGAGSALVAFDGLSTAGDFGYRPINATDDVARANNDARQLAGLGRFATPLGAGGTLDVLVQLERGERGLAGSIQNPSASDRLGDGRFTATGRLTQAVGPGAVELRAFARQDALDVTYASRLPLHELDTLAGAEGRLRTRVGHHGLSLVVRAAGEQLAADGSPDRSRPDLALGATDEWLLFDGALSVLPALRVDRIDRFAGVSPQLALAFRPTDALELRGSLGQSWRAPTFAELYLDQGLLTSNPDLRPERALGADLGATLELGPVRASASGFASEYVDLIEYELYPPFRAKPFNVGTAGIAGAEAELSARPRRELELSAVYTRQWTADLYDDVRFYQHELPYHPHHRGGLRAAWTASRLTAHAEAFAQSAQYLSRANTAAVGARVDTAAGLAFRPIAKEPIWLGAEAQNLFDVRSQDLYGYPLPGRALFALVRIATPQPEHP